METDARLLVTGASGFLGTNMLEAARRNGITVAGFDIAPPRHPAHRDLVSRVDLLDAVALKRAVAGFQPTHVVHLGARTDLNETKELSGYAPNIEGVSNLIEALDHRAIQRAVIASSMLVCRNGYPPRDEFDLCPTTLYGESKVRTEQIVRTCKDLDWVIVRPTSIWGPWFGTPYRDFFLAVAGGRYVKPGHAGTMKAMGYVGNIVQQIEALLTAPRALVSGRTFYVSDYTPYPLDDWADEIADAVGRRRPPRVPMAVLRVGAKIGDGMERLGKRLPITSFRLKNMLTSSSFDMSELAAIVGPERFDRHRGIGETVAWLRTSRSI